MKTQLTAIDIHRCYIVTITQHKDLEECRKVCDHADRCIKIEDVKGR